MICLSLTYPVRSIVLSTAKLSSTNLSVSNLSAIDLPANNLSANNLSALSKFMISGYVERNSDIDSYVHNSWIVPLRQRETPTGFLVSNSLQRPMHTDCEAQVMMKYHSTWFPGSSNWLTKSEEVCSRNLRKLSRTSLKNSSARNSRSHRRRSTQLWQSYLWQHLQRAKTLWQQLNLVNRFQNHLSQWVQFRVQSVPWSVRELF